jgi:WD40 repeat protein
LLRTGIEETDEVGSSPTLRAEKRPASAHYFGDYQLLRQVGRGGMGMVYEARQFGTQRSVALKLLTDGTLATREAVHRFHTEAQAAALLEHPNIVPIYEVGMHDGQYFMAMRFLGGGTLGERAAQGGLSPRSIAELMREIAGAVHFAHTRGVLHRDLKPSNILLSDQGVPLVSDFGLARIMTVDDRLTLSTSLLGTAAYLAPEQIKGGAGSSTIASDLYSLGVILYELLTGHPPFRGNTVGDTLRLVQEQQPTSPSKACTIGQRVPLDLETICLKCLEKEPFCRYSTAQDLVDDLNRFLADEPIHARPANRLDRAWRWCHRKPALAVLSGLALALLLVVCLGAPIATVRINRARLAAERSRLDTQRSLYAADMRLASEALRDGAVDEVRQLLLAHEPRNGAEDLRGFEWRYFWHAADQTGLVTRQLQGLKGTGAVPYADWAVSGNTLYNWLSGTEQILAWDIDTWTPLAMKLPAQPTSNRWWLRPWEQAAFAVNDGERTIAVYRLPGFEETSVISVPGPAVGAALSPDLRTLAVGFRDGAVQRILVCGLTPNSRRDVFGEYRGKLVHLAFWPQDDVLSAACDDGVVGLWSIPEHKALPSPAPNLSGRVETWPQPPFFGKGSTRLYLNRGAERKALEVWDWNAGKLSTVYRAQLDQLHVFAFSPDTATLAVARSDGTIVLLDTKEYRQLGATAPNRGRIISLAFSPSGKLLAAGNLDRSVKLWDVRTLRELRTLGGNSDQVREVVFTKDEKSLISLLGDGTIKAWDLSVVLAQEVPWSTTNRISDLAFSKDERTVVTTDNLGTFHFWDGVGGHETWSVQTGEMLALGFCFSPTDHLLAWQGWNSVGLVDYQSKQTNIISLPRRGGCSLSFSPDGGEFAFAGPTNILIWDIATAERRLFAVTRNRAFALAYSPNGSLLASVHSDGALILWDRASGREITNVLAHSPGAFFLTFSPDGRFIASEGSDEMGKIWELVPGGLKLRHTLRGHVGSPLPQGGIDFSPDGRRLVSSSAFDNTLKFFDTGSGLEVGNIYCPNGRFVAFAFSRDGNAMYTADTGGEVRRWQAPPLEQLQPTAKEKVRP